MKHDLFNLKSFSEHSFLSLLFVCSAPVGPKSLLGATFTNFLRQTFSFGKAVPTPDYYSLIHKGKRFSAWTWTGQPVIQRAKRTFIRLKQPESLSDDGSNEDEFWDFLKRKEKKKSFLNLIYPQPHIARTLRSTRIRVSTLCSQVGLVVGSQTSCATTVSESRSEQKARLPWATREAALIVSVLLLN